MSLASIDFDTFAGRVRPTNQVPRPGASSGVDRPMKFVKIAALAIGMLSAASATADAQALSASEQATLSSASATRHAFSDLRGVGAGLIIIGAAMGIGMIAKASVESMARQPEVAGQINTSMIIAAALIEGVTFFALIIVILQRTPY